MEIEPEEDDKKEYSCPSNHSHKIFGRDALQKHIMRCKDIQGKRFYQCKYDWTHMFHYSTERDKHEEACPCKREGVQRYKDYLFVPLDKERLAEEPEKERNRIDSAYYFHKNYQKIQEEKEMRRRLREKREAQEAIEKANQDAILKRRAELERFYSQDYMLENVFYLTTEWDNFFMIIAQKGARKIEKKNIEMKTTIDLEEKLLQISQLEYNKILAAEFVPHYEYSYNDRYMRLKRRIDTEASIACFDYCETNDELVVITSSKFVPYVPEDRLVMLVLRYSKFLLDERPFDIPENNTSNIFVNEYNQFLEIYDEQDQHEKLLENDNAIATFEYRESIKKKLRQVISLLEDSKVSQADINQRRNDEITLSALIEEEKKLKHHEVELNQKDARMGTELADYKKKLTRDFMEKVSEKQEQLNTDINAFYSVKFPQFQALDQENEKLTEEESELRDKYAKINGQIEMNQKSRKKYEARVQILQGQINEKKRMLSVSKNIALTSVLDYLCHICQKNSIDILFYPCNHFFACQECQKKASEVGRHECLYCHQNVEKVLHVLV